MIWTLLIVVEYTNTALFQRYEWNELRQQEAELLQHELDHLDGT